MTTKEIREKYLEFFKKRDHKEITPSPLVLENDPTTLFTSSGMQQLIPYLKGEKHPDGKRLVDIQPSVRMQDLDEVADNRHYSFFEMLGNWSLGDYFKKEQLPMIWEFFTKELNLDPAKLYVSVFEGNDNVPKDTESFEAWKKIGVPEDKIFFYGVDKSWWSRSGSPDKMPAGEIGGPDSEVFYEFDTPHDPKFGKFCHPNCDCGKFLEIGNNVFIQYLKMEDGTLKELPQKNVDFG
jgi:alanyl-tRNA synthetase